MACGKSGKARDSFTVVVFACVELVKLLLNYCGLFAFQQRAPDGPCYVPLSLINQLTSKLSST
jgi:hypothetical protein